MYHYFRLDPFIYTNGPYSNKILLYNTLDASHIVYDIKMEEQLILSNSILIIKNIDSDIPYLFYILEERNMGVIMNSTSQVFSLNMEERLMNNYKELENVFNPLINDNLLNHLLEITYCFKRLDTTSLSMDKISKQYSLFSYTEDCEKINYQLLNNVLSKNNYQNLSAINYVGINYNDFDTNIIPIYKETSYYPSNIILPYSTYISEDIISNPYLKYVIICDNKMINEFDYFINNNDNSKLVIHFYISSEDEYFFINSKLKTLRDLQYKIFVYQKLNDDFLDNYIKYPINEALNRRLNINQIVRSGIINELYYGKITIHNNGEVFSNIQEDALGNLNSENINTLLYKASVDKSSWRLTRENFSCCNQCIFNRICPPISEIEQYTSKVYCIK